MACRIGVNRCILLCIGGGRHVQSMPLNSLLLDATLVVAWLNISSVVSLDILHAEEVLIDAYFFVLGVEDMYIACHLTAYY